MSTPLKKYWTSILKRCSPTGDAGEILLIGGGECRVYLAAEAEQRDEDLHVGLEQILAMAPDGGEIKRVATRLLAELDGK